MSRSEYQLNDTRASSNSQTFVLRFYQEAISSVFGPVRGNFPAPIMEEGSSVMKEYRCGGLCEFFPTGQRVPMFGRDYGLLLGALLKTLLLEGKVARMN